MTHNLGNIGKPFFKEEKKKKPILYKLINFTLFVALFGFLSINYYLNNEIHQLQENQEKTQNNNKNLLKINQELTKKIKILEKQPKIEQGAIVP